MGEVFFYTMNMQDYRVSFPYPSGLYTLASAVGTKQPMMYLLRQTQTLCYFTRVPKQQSLRVLNWETHSFIHLLIGFVQVWAQSQSAGTYRKEQQRAIQSTLQFESSPKYKMNLNLSFTLKQISVCPRQSELNCGIVQLHT